MKKLFTFMMLSLVVVFTAQAALGDLTLKVKKTDYSWNTGNHSRSAAYYDGNLYVIDKNNKQVHVLNATTGAEGTPISDANFTGYGITYNANGDSYVTSGAYGMTDNLQGTLTPKGKAEAYANTASSGTNRIDFVTAYGDFNTTGYLAGASINTGDVVAIWKVENGALVTLGSPIKISGKRVGGFASGADVAWVAPNKLLLTAQAKPAQIMTIDLSTPANSSSQQIGEITTGAGGGAYFELGSTPYVAIPIANATDARYGGVDVYDISSMSTPVKVATTAAIGTNDNASVHLSIHAKVAEVGGNYIVTLYIWAPNNGLAIYEMDGGPVPEEDENPQTYTVTVPAGTTNVYVVGNFPDKEWDINNPYELSPTLNPNEFSGTFNSAETPAYKYLNAKASWDYGEAKLADGNLIIHEGKPLGADNRSYNANDVVKYWVATPKASFNVSFAAGINTPANLFVKGDWDSWAAGKALTKSGDTYSLTVNEKTFANTEYKYYSNDPSADNWETIGSNRWAIYPTMNDEITGFNTAIPDAEPTGLILKFKKTDYTWNVSDAARSAAYYDGNVYVIDKGNTKVHKLNASTGAEVSAVTDANYKGVSITMDNNGNQFVHSSFPSTSGIGGTIVINGGLSTHSQALGITPSFGRVDFFAVTGNLATNAHIAGASTNTVDAIAVWKVENGVFTDMANPIQILEKRGGTFTSTAGATAADITWLSENQIITTAQNQKVMLITLDLNNPVNSTSQQIGSLTTTAGGGKYFKIGSTPFVALAEDRFGVVEVYNITNINEPTLVGTTQAVGANANGSVHVSIMATVSGNTATLYVWAPNNGLAKYEYIHISTDKEENNIDSSQTFSITNTATGISIPLNTASVVELYTVNGLLLDRVNTSSTYTRDLDNGIYIVRVNGKAQKFVK